MSPIFPPITFAAFCSNLPDIRCLLPWTQKRTIASIKKQKSLARQHSSRRIPRDPTVRHIRAPPRERGGKIARSPSNLHLRSAQLRAKRVKIRTKNLNRAPKPAPPPNPHRPPHAERQRPVPRPKTAQEKLDSAYRKAQRSIPRPRTQVDEIFIRELAKLNVIHSYQTEGFRNRVRLDEASKPANLKQRLDEDAKHDAQARKLREKRDQQTTTPVSDSTRSSGPSGQPKSKPKSLAEVSFGPGWKAHLEMLKEAEEWKAHQARIARGEVPASTRFPLKHQGSLHEKVRAGIERTKAELREKRRKQEEAAQAREAAARAQFRTQTEEKRRQGRIRAAWDERIRQETALKEELKAAEEEDARRRAEAQANAQMPASSFFIPPRTDTKPGTYEWELYRRRWAALKRESSEEVPAPLTINQLPWPQFGDVFGLDDLSPIAIKHFLLNYLRPGYESKLPRERLRLELMLYHPDKFNARVLPYVMEDQRDLVAAVASRVTVVLHDLLRFVANRMP